MKKLSIIKLTELRPGIGLCDECGEPRWPQKYIGYGMMVCADCLANDKAHNSRRRNDIKTIRR